MQLCIIWAATQEGAVTKLAQRLKHVIEIRRKRAKRGRLDLQQTLRKNL